MTGLFSKPKLPAAPPPAPSSEDEAARMARLKEMTGKKGGRSKVVSLTKLSGGGSSPVVGAPGRNMKTGGG